MKKIPIYTHEKGCVPAKYLDMETGNILDNPLMTQEQLQEWKNKIDGFFVHGDLDAFRQVETTHKGGENQD